MEDLSQHLVTMIGTAAIKHFRDGYNSGYSQGKKSQGVNGLIDGIDSLRVADSPTPPPPSLTNIFDNLAQPPQGRATRSQAVTEFIDEHSPKITTSVGQFDNSAVHSAANDEALGIVILPEPKFGGRPDLSQKHDIFLFGGIGISGLGLVPHECEVEFVLPLTQPQNRTIHLRGRIDMLAVDPRDNSIWVIDYKTSSHIGQTHWRKDLIRRTYIQQVMLYGLAVEKLCKQAPRGCILIGLSTTNEPVARRVQIAYNPKLWLKDINVHLACFKRLNNSESAPSALPEALLLD